MQCAVEMAGFDERQANALRKALGHWGVNSQISYFAKMFRDGARDQWQRRGNQPGMGNDFLICWLFLLQGALRKLRHGEFSMRLA